MIKRAGKSTSDNTGKRITQVSNETGFTVSEYSNAVINNYILHNYINKNVIYYMIMNDNMFRTIVLVLY